jgi:hypothetical protein
LEAMVRVWQLDLSAQDMHDLISELSPNGNSISRKLWQNAIVSEQTARDCLVRVLTIVASALLWDVRTVHDSFPSKTSEGVHASDIPNFISKMDLTETNDSWQVTIYICQIKLTVTFLLTVVN